MVDYSKWDNLELSDDSDIEVHPNVDKRSFIRAKQHQIHTERQQRRFQIEALKYERTINGELMQRLSALISSLKSPVQEHRTRSPAEVAFQAVMELALRSPEEDNPPPRLEGVYEGGQSPPTYSKMIASIVDDVNKKLDEKSIEQEKRYDAFIKEIGIHVQNIQDLQSESLNKLDSLQKEDAKAITSESYHTGFDTSHVNKAKSDEKSTAASKIELLNPNFDMDKAIADIGTNVAADIPQDGDEEARASPQAKTFAKIEPSDYRASHEFISSHPEILQESESDGLLVEAFNTALENNDRAKTRQYVHQALLLQWCRMLGRDGVAIFFKRITTPGHEAREVFNKDVAEKSQRIWELAAKQRAAERSEAVEQIQIQTVEPGTVIQIRIPDANSEDVDVRKARAIFEQFTSETKAALESGSLDNVNKVLGMMNIVEAENLVNLLGDAGCLNIEREIIDATTEDGKKRLKDMKEVAVAESESM